MQPQVDDSYDNLLCAIKKYFNIEIYISDTGLGFSALVL